MLAELLPGLLVVRGVIAATAQLEDAGSARDWLEACPLMLHVEEAIEPTGLDRAIAAELPHLSAVCWRPRDRLGVERELTDVRRARRFAPEALARLAAHSEDWAAWNGATVEPARLLTLNRVHDVDFYENRVAGQLVDRLRSYLAERIRDLRTVMRHLSDLRDVDSRALHGEQSWRKRERLSVLLGGAVADSSQRTAASRIIEEMQGLHAAVGSLCGSLTYRSVNRGFVLSMVLHRTNLLVNDHHYRGLERVWRAWAAREMALASEERAVTSAFATSYPRYTAMLALRACRDLGLSPDPSDAPMPATPGIPLQLAGPAGHATFSFTEEGAVDVELAGRWPVRIVPVVRALTAEPSTVAVEEALRMLIESQRSNDAPTVVVYPGLLEERERLPAPLRRLAHTSGPSLGDGERGGRLVGLVPATPFEIHSVERLARALRWALHGVPLLERYPPVLRVPRSVRQSPAAGAATWLGWHPDGLTVLRQPNDAERQALESVSGDGQPVVQRRRQRTTTVHGPEELREQLAGADEDLRSIRTCPLCGNDAKLFEPRDYGTFHCRCACDGQWGVRTCGSCGRRYPVLWSKLPLLPGGDGDHLDHAFGSELLAVPCTTPTDSPRFRCPWCRWCPGQDACRCDP